MHHSTLNAFVPSTQQKLSAPPKDKKTSRLHDFLLMAAVKRTYQWTNPTNKSEALEHLEALQNALKFGFSTQAMLYKDKIREIVARDLVQHAKARIPQTHRYCGFTYYHESESLPSTSFYAYFTLPGEQQGLRWSVYRINDFKQMIPPVALHVLSALGEVGLAADGFWIAEEEKRIDPILFANFGLNFVALAVWV